MTRGGPRADVRTLVAWAAAGGWTATATSGGHLRLACPCGRHLVHLPQTPSDTRSLANARAQVKRACPSSVW